MESIFFAPLQGYTDAAYRNAHARNFRGIETYYTPFVRLEKGEVRTRDLRDILPENNQDTCVCPQMIAGNVDEFHALMKVILPLGYRDVDLNFGCPFPLLVRKQKGCGILPFPEKVGILLDAIKDYPDIHFSVKMRLGQENVEECLNLLPMLNRTLLQHITMHPRLGIQQYKGEVDMEAFQRFYENCDHPVIYNGNLKTPEEIAYIEEKFSHLKGVMIGRGLLANPALAEEYKYEHILSFEERLERILLMHDEIFRLYEARLQGETQLLGKMHAFWEYLIPQLEKKIYKKIMKSSKLCNYIDAVEKLKNY